MTITNVSCRLLKPSLPPLPSWVSALNKVHSMSSSSHSPHYVQGCTDNTLHPQLQSCIKYSVFTSFSYFLLLADMPEGRAYLKRDTEAIVIRLDQTKSKLK